MCSLAGEEYENEVLKVVGDTFEETIASGKDVLLNFYGDFSWYVSVTLCSKRTHSRVREHIL